MTVIQKSSPTVKGVKTTTSDCTERRHSSSSPCKMSQNGSSGYYEGDVLLDDDALVSMPEATLIECFGNLAVTKRPAHLRPPAAFCLPFVSMNNDLTSGHALKHITLTSVFDALHPYVAMPYINRMDICSAMNVYWIRNCLEAEQSDLFHRFALEMQVHLSACFGCRVVLDIYGSTRNGFGTRFCDVDMSLSFSPSPPSWATNSDRVMRAVAKALVDFPKAVDERYVNAKVPIVRFRSSDMDMEADISYKNDLALNSTQILQQCFKWDPEKLPTLGVWLKARARRCGIGYASKGSLSILTPVLTNDPVEADHYLAQRVDLSVYEYIRSCMEHSKKVFTDRRMRSEFLSGYGFDVDEFDARHRGEMNMEMASQFGEFLLHKCIMVKQAPNRQFRDRSMSQSTSISNTSSISSSG